jgi:hypothetical protein
MKHFLTSSAICLLICFGFSTQFTKAQACGYATGRISVFNEKNKPLKNFKVAFYLLENFDFLNSKTKVVRNELAGNAWDIYLTQKEAEDIINGKTPYDISGEQFGIDDEKERRETIFYKDNIFFYRTLEGYGRPFLIKVQARGYENFYFVAPALGGCGYYNEIKLKKR